MDGKSPAATLQWQEYRPAGAGFRIDLPGEPKVDDARRIVTSDGIPTITGVELGGRQFDVFHSVFQDVLGDRETMLMIARENLLRNRDRVLREEQTLEIDEVPAMRLVIDVPPEGTVVIVLVAFDGREMCQAIYVGPVGTEASTDAQRFIGSLRAVPR